VLGLEKLIALGAGRIWVTGWCGSLQADLRIGDLVVPVDALPEEGTSQHYPLPQPDPATDEGLRKALAAALERRGLNARSGRLWTTDAVYRETRDKVLAMGRAGVLAVDMEISALLTVAAYRGVRLAGLLVVSDELSGGAWHPGFSSRELRGGSSAAVGTILEAIDSTRSRHGA
jgi:uridine phosphorylase